MEIPTEIMNFDEAFRRNANKAQIELDHELKKPRPDQNLIKRLRKDITDDMTNYQRFSSMSYNDRIKEFKKKVEADKRYKAATHFHHYTIRNRANYLIGLLKLADGKALDILGEIIFEFPKDKVSLRDSPEMVRVFEFYNQKIAEWNALVDAEEAQRKAAKEAEKLAKKQQKAAEKAMEKAAKQQQKEAEKAAKLVAKSAKKSPASPAGVADLYRTMSI